jgi:hypothetical protein
MLLADAYESAGLPEQARVAKNRAAENRVAFN